MYDIFEVVCEETSIPLNAEIRTKEELFALITDVDNYTPRSKSCRYFVNVLDNLMVKLATLEVSEDTDKHVNELTDLIVSKLVTYPVNYLKYGVKNIGEWDRDPLSEADDQDDADYGYTVHKLIQWLFELQKFGNFRNILELHFSEEIMDELKTDLDIFYSYENEVRG